VIHHYNDRRDAGRALALYLVPYAGREDVTVLGLPRGGVPVAFEVAQGLGAPLDVLPVRPLVVPGRPELAVGAVAAGGVGFLDEGLVSRMGISRRTVEAAVAGAEQELARMELTYRADRPPLELVGRTVILVDDGLTTSATMRAAIAAVRRRGAARAVVAVPVAPPETCEELAPLAEAVVCAAVPEAFVCIDSWYADFAPPTDDAIDDLLQAAQRSRARAPAPEQWLG
jgi:predicted phosphoribosyltransferase